MHVLYFNGLIIGKMNEMKKKENIFFIFVIFLTKFLVLILNIYKTYRGNCTNVK